MSFPTRFLAAALLGAAAILTVSAVNAQDQNKQDESPSPGVTQPTPNIPEDKLNAAAAAIERVANLKESFQQRLAEAAPTERERIVDEANSAITKAVTDQGLSVDEYATILMVAQVNPEVRGRILQRLQESAK
jgi:hypothetical protein